MYLGLSTFIIRVNSSSSNKYIIFVYIIFKIFVKLFNRFILYLFVMKIVNSIIVTNSPIDVDIMLPNVRSYPIRYVLLISGISNIIFINSPNKMLIFIFLFDILLIHNLILVR